MYGRENLECPTLDEYFGDGEYETCTDKYYYKEDADNVMDAMEARIKHLESILDLDPRTNLSLVDENQQLRSRIKELEKRLEDVQNTMATENVDLGMENYKLKERIKELEAAICIFETTQKWISVEDRLPDENKKVLVTNPSAHTSKIAWKYCGHWFFDTNFDVLEPTHWMPFPPPLTTKEK